MITKERAEKLVGILNANEDSANKWFEMEAPAVLEQINALGNDFTLDELQEFGKAMGTAPTTDDGELDADALDSVAGGAWFSALFTGLKPKPKAPGPIWPWNRGML